MSACPDCGAEVVEVERSTSRCARLVQLAEPADDGPWVLGVPFDSDRLPWTMKASMAREGADRYRQHRCSRRAKVEGSLTTIAAVYGEKWPRVNVSATELQGDVQKGDVVTLYDAAGNEVRADVVGVEFVAVPREGTLRNPEAEERQTTLEPEGAAPSAAPSGGITREARSPGTVERGNKHG